MLTLGIPTYICYDELERCLASFREGNLAPAQVHIVDNNDMGKNLLEHAGVVKQLNRFEKAFVSTFYESPPAWAGVEMRVKTNIGVARAWNHIINSHSDTWCIISNDDIAAYPDTVEKLYRAAEKDSSQYFFRPVGTGAPNAYSLFLIKPAMFDVMGGFDGNFYYAYYEDSDHHHRARKLGIQHVDVEDCSAAHTESSTVKAMPYDRITHHHNHFRQMQAYFIMKWGQDSNQDEGRYEEPFNGAPPYVPRKYPDGGEWRLEGWTPPAETVQVR